MFNIRTKVIVESATVELDTVQIGQLVRAVEPLRVIQGREIEGVDWDKLYPLQQFVLSLADTVAVGTLLAPAAAATGKRGKRVQAVNPTPGEPA